jgi:hypothetical protein
MIKLQSLTFFDQTYTSGKTLNISQHVQVALLSFQSVSYTPHTNRYIKVNVNVLNTHIQMHIYIFTHQDTNLNTKTHIKRSSLINMYVAHISRHTPKLFDLFALYFYELFLSSLYHKVKLWTCLNVWVMLESFELMFFFFFFAMTNLWSCFPFYIF